MGAYCHNSQRIPMMEFHFRLNILVFMFPNIVNETLNSLFSEMQSQFMTGVLFRAAFLAKLQRRFPEKKSKQIVLGSNHL